MRARSLRHRLEKAAKALVLIHKWTPNVDCLLDEDKGEYGHLILKFDDGDTSKINALGKDLESKGYRFRIKNSQWLGQLTYLGKADNKATVVMTLPITKNRLAINDQSPERAHSFK